MNTPANRLCQCIDCPGASCRCGCQSDAAPPTPAAAPPACACGPRCGCAAAPQGCLCGSGAS
jgi:hypothetical protein